MPTSIISTATAAKLFIAISVAQAPTVSTIPGALEPTVRSAQKPTTKIFQATQSSVITTVATHETFDVSARETTSLEKLIGEIRNWALFEADWDGEGSVQPSAASIKEIVSFARLINTETQYPEPMLLASGHTALFWNGDGLYADLEFLGDNRIAYFIKKNSDQHKGVVKFDSESMPVVFQAILNV